MRILLCDSNLINGGPNGSGVNSLLDFTSYNACLIYI